MSKKKIWESIDQNSQMLTKMARDIWEYPEVSLEEVHASKLQAKVLEDAQFNVTLGLKGLPTGIVAEYGSGKPIIGILGEYDALESLSQDSVPERKIRVEGGHGHGCGHNLLGTGGVGAAIAIKEAIERGDLHGTIRYYGCPAEEELVGKLFMLRDGYFDNCDALLYWHPGANNTPWRVPCLASTSIVFTFKGLTAHAPQAHLGRSALDAVELMNVGANYLREHLPREVMFHYSILGNGIAPNTVPDICQSWYMMRAPERSYLDEAFPRLVDVAKGAAMMTGTTLENVEVLGGGNDMVMNQTLADLFVENMDELGGPSFTEEDYAFAKQLSDQFTPEQKLWGAKAFQIPPEYYDKVLLDKIFLQLEVGKKELQDMADDKDQVFAFAANNLYSYSDILDQYNKLYPSSHYRQIVGSTQRMRQSLLNGEIDFCLSSPSIVGDDIECIPLATEEMYLFVSKDHRFSGRSSIILSEAADEPFISLPPEFGIRDLLESLCQQAGFKPNIVFESLLSNGILDLVNINMGITLLPIPKWAKHPENMTVPIRISEPHCFRTVSLSYMKDRYLSDAKKAFIDYVINYFKTIENISAPKIKEY